jgi:hypothetical protein
MMVVTEAGAVEEMEVARAAADTETHAAGSHVMGAVTVVVAAVRQKKRKRKRSVIRRMRNGKAFTTRITPRARKSSKKWARKWLRALLLVVSQAQRKQKRPQ